MKMQSDNKSAESSGNNPPSSERSKRLEETFLRAERQNTGRTFARDKQIRNLTLQQYQISNDISSMRLEVTNDLNELRQDLEKKATEQFKEASGTIDQKVKDVEDGLDKKVLEARNKIIEPLAIFVGLFTFISISFQVFTQVKEYVLWMPILAAVLGGIIIFAGLIIHASSISADVESRRKYTIGIVVIGLILFISAGYYYHQAAQMIRAEDMKECIVAINPEDNNETTYCKLKR